jgi:hypothetical protein
MEQNTTSETKKGKAWNWIAIVLGTLVCAAGLFSWFGDDETMNNTLIEAGIAQSCTSLLAEYPDAQPHLAKAADVVEAAIEARLTKPDELADLISQALADASGQQINVEAFIKAFVTKINEAHAVSETEEQYHAKLKVLVAGIRSAIN